MTGLNILNRITLLDSKSARLIKEFLDAYFKNAKREEKSPFNKIDRLKIECKQTSYKITVIEKK